MQKIPVRHIKDPIKEPEFFKSFVIRDIKQLLEGKDMVQELHRHDFFLILALKKAKGEHVIDFTEYTVTDNSVFFMRPGQVHELILRKESTGYILQFNNDFYSPRDNAAGQIFRRVSSRNYCKPTPRSFGKLIGPLTNIFREYTTKQENYQQAIKANLQLFFIELARQSNDPKNISKVSDQYSQQQLGIFLELLQTRITTIKEVAAYANMMHLTPWQLNSITKTTIGKTASALINEQIVLEAKRGLLATSDQVNQIADQLGYDDVSYFIRFFKRNTGYTPEAFRKNFK